jgi:hypothetical protein
MSSFCASVDLILRGVARGSAAAADGDAERASIAL